MSDQAPSTDIECIDTISSDDFYRFYIRPQKPVIITDLATRWPAMQKWSFEFFADLGNAEFDVEHGNVLQGETRFEKQDFQSFVRGLMAEEAELGANPGPKSYLSQSDIFAAFPELCEDVDFSILTQHKWKNIMLGWLGPKGTFTGFHFDYADGLLAQICGQKFVQLVSPEQSACMYLSTKFDYGSKLSQIDSRQYDPQKFPRFAEVRMQTSHLDPGQMLYIPRGWWHEVESLSASISVNTFSIGLKGTLLDRIPEKIKSILHSYGLYGADCTCHMTKNGERTTNNALASS